MKIPTYDEACAMYGADAMLGGRETELFRDLGCITNTLDRNETISFNEYGATTNCGKNLLSKELLDSCIKRLQAISDYYNNYRIAFLNDREEAFRERYVKYVSEDITEKNVRNAHDDRGYIYIMKMLDYYKIGKTKNGKRLKEYTKLPEEPEYVAYMLVPDMSATEKTLHEMFKDVRLREGRCEWFALTEDDLNKAREIIKKHSAEFTMVNP